MIINHRSFFLLLDLGFLNLGLLCFWLLRLLLQDLVVCLAGLLENGLESLEFLFGGKTSAKLFSLEDLVGNVLSTPGPCIVAGLELFEFSEDIVLADDIVVEDAFVSGFSSHEDPDES